MESKHVLVIVSQHTGMPERGGIVPESWEEWERHFRERFPDPPPKKMKKTKLPKRKEQLQSA